METGTFPSEAAAVRRSLNLVTVAGCLAMVYFACLTCPSSTEFFRSLGAGEIFFGLLGGIPLLAVSFHFLGAVINNHVHRRKPLFMGMVIAGRLLSAPMVLVPLAFAASNRDLAFAVALAVAAAGSVLQNVTVPVWLSWMADLIPSADLNSYWGRRQVWMQLTLTVSLVAIVLFTYATDFPVTVSFPILAIVGVAAGVVDIVLFGWIQEPPNARVADRPILETLLAPLRHPEFRTFILFSCAWSASVMFSAVFMQLYVLKGLGLSVWLTTLIWCSGLANALTAAFWGRMADRHGHRPVLNICVALKPVLLLVFLVVTPSTALWILPVAFFFDSAWEAGVMVASNGYMLKMAPQENRSMFIAAITGLAGLCGGLAAIGGGIFLKGFSGFECAAFGRTWTNFHLLFLVSFVMRAACLALSRRIVEPSSTRTVHVLNEVMGVWPMQFLLFPLVLYRKLVPPENRD